MYVQNVVCSTAHESDFVKNHFSSVFILSVHAQYSQKYSMLYSNNSVIVELFKAIKINDKHVNHACDIVTSGHYTRSIELVSVCMYICECPCMQ